MSFVISTDTSANLPTSLIKEHDFLVLPFTYILRGKEHQCLDIDSFDGESYYNELKETHATTSMINQEQYRAAWEPIAAAGKDILHIAMSSGISGSYGASCAAAREINEKGYAGRVVTIDTYGASLGEGLQAVRAAKFRREGLSFEETVKRIENGRLTMQQVFTVDDLMHLKRTGRVTGVTAIIGTLLHIKPILGANRQGQIIVTGKARGRKKALEALAKAYAEDVKDPAGEIAGIAEAGCPEDAAALCDMIHDVHPEQEIITVCYEPVTGCHVGPGALALFYWGKRERGLGPEAAAARSETKEASVLQRLGNSVQDLPAVQAMAKRRETRHAMPKA